MLSRAVLTLATGAALGGHGALWAAPPASAPVGPDPFATLRLVTRNVGVLRTVRARDRRDRLDRSRTERIAVVINTSPQGASVSTGSRALGSTPLTLGAQRNSTPLDVIIRRGGYMSLRTRVYRTTSRTYHFRLTPAKFR